MALTSLFHRFRDVKIVFKLTGGFGLILSLFLGVILISDMSGRSAIGAFKQLISSDLGMVNHAENVHALLLECRNNEKDFMLSRNIRFRSQLEDTVSIIKNELNAMASIATDTRAIDDIARNIDEYASSFADLVASFEKNGLDHNSGLQGRFREAVHQIETDMAAHDLTQAHIALLTMRGNEKDYIRTWSSKYKPMMTQSMGAFRETLGHIVTDKEAMADITRGFDAYEAGFNRYFSSDEKERALIYEDIRSAAREMEDGFRKVVVPETRSMLLTVRRHEKDYLLRHDPKYVTQTHAALDTLVKAFEAAPILDRLKTNRITSVQNYRRMFDALVTEQNRIAAHKEHIAEAVARIEPLVQGLKTSARTSADHGIAQTENTTFSTLGFVLGIAIVALFIGIAFAFLMTRNITRSLNRTVAFAGEITQGNLSTYLDISGKDEMGSLASSMNTMTGQLKQIIEKIARDTGMLQLSSDDLFGVSAQLTKGSSDLSGQSNQVQESSETIRDLMRRVTGSSGEASTNLNLLAAATEEMTSTVGEILANAEKARAMTEDAVSQVNRAAQRIDGLGQSAKDIDAVTDTIRDISDQTNLLALNATIEAARAGEAGKGFAVVAHEIKELARQTSESTRSIRSTIEGIQGASNQTVQDIGHISSMIRGIADIVGQVASAVEEQSITTREITQNAARSSQGLEAINQDVDQTTQGIEHISEEIKRVSFFSAELEENSRSVNKSAEHLAGLVSSLNTLVSGFTLSDGQNVATLSPSTIGKPSASSRPSS